MKHVKSAAALVVVLALGLAAPITSRAADFSFGELLTGSTPAPATSFAELSVTANATNTVFTFDLRTASNLDSLFGASGVFISAMLINTISNTDPASVAIIPFPTGYSEEQGVARVTLTTNPSNAGGISWDSQFNFCGPATGSCNNSNSDNRRLQQDEQVRWTVTFASAQDPSLFDAPFMALHVQSLAGGASARYTPISPVPEPEIYAMLLAGLGLMGFVAKRRRLTHAAA